MTEREINCSTHSLRNQFQESAIALHLLKTFLLGQDELPSGKLKICFT